MLPAEDRPATPGEDPAVTYLLVDGENLDGALKNLLGRPPTPDKRPRWDRAVAFVESTWGQPVKALFFINSSSGWLPMPFLQALQAMGVRPVLLSGPPDVKVVDIGIQRTLEAIAQRPSDVMLASHDGDFLSQVEALLGDGRRVGQLAFRELINVRYGHLASAGLMTFDLEDDAGCFTYRLPRLRIIDIDQFDPESFL